LQANDQESPAETSGFFFAIIRANQARSPGQLRPKWTARAMSGLPPLATELRTSLVVRFVP
jgi:hypothetical protein